MGRPVRQRIRQHLSRGGEWLVHWRIWLLVAAAALWGLGILFGPADTHPIDSYARCVADGNPVLETDPPICRDGGRNYTGPHATPTPTADVLTTVQFYTLVSGDSGGTYPRAQEVIHNQVEWERYWTAVHAGLPKVPPILSVDFTQNVVLALSEGPQATGGYNLRVAGILTGPHGTVIDATETVPTITCVVTQARTNRYVIVEAPKLAEPVIFRLTSDKHHC